MLALLISVPVRVTAAGPAAAPKALMPAQVPIAPAPSFPVSPATESSPIVVSTTGAEDAPDETSAL